VLKCLKVRLLLVKGEERPYISNAEGVAEFHFIEGKAIVPHVVLEGAED
jgi:hypothetical protein